MNKNLMEINKSVSLPHSSSQVQSKALVKNIQEDSEIIYAKPNIIGDTNQNKIAATAVNNVFCS